MPHSVSCDDGQVTKPVLDRPQLQSGLPFFRLPPQFSQPLHFLAEVLVLVPVEAVVPEDSHQLVRLLHSRVVSNPLLTLLFGLVFEFPQHVPGRLSQRSSDLNQRCYRKLFQLGIRRTSPNIWALNLFILLAYSLLLFIVLA